MRSRYIISFLLISIFIFNCQKPSQNKRKIKLSSGQQLTNQLINSDQSTTLKFDALKKRSIAILTFENLSGDKNLEWLSNGITDMLIRDFSQSHYLKVITLQRIYDIFKQLDIQSPSQIDQEMISTIGSHAQVEAVIKGTFSGAKDSLVINVQLYNIPYGELIQSEKVIGSGLEQIFSMIDELTQKIKSDLRISLRDKVEQDLGIADISTKSLEAYRYYTEGIDLVYKAYLGDAIKKFEKAIESDSTFAIAHLWAGIVYMYLDKIDEATHSIDKAMTFSENVSPKEKMKIEWISAVFNHNRKKSFQLLKELVEEYPDDKEMRFQLAGTYLYNQEIEKAKEQLELVLKLDPEFAQAYNLQSVIFREKGDYANAIKWQKKYIKLRPDEATPHHNLAEIYEALGEYTKAIKQYQIALSLKPDFHFSIFSLANIYTILGQYRKAEQTYLSALDVLPSEEMKARVYAGLAQIDMSMGKYNNAIKQIKQALKFPTSDKGKANYLVMMAGIYYHKEVFDSSLVLTEKALSYQKKNLSAYAQKARTFLKIGEIDSAKKIAYAMDQVIKDSKLEILRNLHLKLLMKIAFAEKRYDDAINLCQQILTDNPEATSIYKDLGMIYMEMNQPHKAIANYLKYSAKNPNHALINYQLALAYEAAGKSSKAKRLMKKFLNMWEHADADIPQLIKAKRKISEWEKNI